MIFKNINSNRISIVKLTLAPIFLFLLKNGFVSAKDPALWVNPFIGTSNYGATFPGPVLPWGMVSVVPYNVSPVEGNNSSNTNNWCSNPYVYSNKVMTGFSHVNLSGVGCPDLGSIILMPLTGDLEVDFNKYGSTYSNEIAKPGYYSSFLDKYKVKAEVTTTTRTGLSRYTFPKGRSHILINLGHGLTNESGASMRMVSDTEIEGYKIMGTFCYNPDAVFPVYFVVKLSKPASRNGYWKEQKQLPGHRHNWDSTSGKYKIYNSYYKELAGDNIGSWFSFDTKEGEQIEVKVGVSYVSIENARLNLQAEQPGFNFEKTASDAWSEWNKQLSKIEVEGGTDNDKAIFYTALYHILIHPNILQDVNGMYPGMESPKKFVTGQNRYTVFSLWDTYRNVHPFLTLVYPQQQLEMVRSMIDMYRESGWLPKWELYGRETNVMNGDPAVIVIADTYMRGLRNFDVQTAYNAMLKSANTSGNLNPIRPDNDFYLKNHYIAFTDSFDNSVSQALEFYVADYSMSQMAKEIGKTGDSKLLYKRSLGYRKYFDKKYNLLRPVNADGTFMDGFNPLQGNNFEPVHGFHEGNSWQYSFAIPHDIPGLVKLMGGRRKFTAHLQKCFDESHFDMGNEPDISYPYLFNFISGEEWRTQKTVRLCINKYFSNQPGGLPGNDDTGTMSAWLVYSMMGFYPVTPGNPNYTLTTPVFDKITINLDPNIYSNDKIVIETINNKHGNLYINKIESGNKLINGYFIQHDELIRNGNLRFYLNDNKN